MKKSEGPELLQVGEIWHYRFQIDGQRIQRSSRSRVRGTARRIAMRHWNEVMAWARGERIMPSLNELAQQWIDQRGPVVSKHHAKAMRTFLRCHTYDLGELLLDEITTDHVEAARRLHLADHAPASCNHWLNLINLLGNWAVQRKVIPELPWEVKPLKVQKKPRVMLPVSAALAWLESIDAAEILAVSLGVRLMIGVGLRESEALSARWEWFDWDRRRYTPGQTKGREADPIPLPSWLYDCLFPLQKPEGLVVTHGDGSAYHSGFARLHMRRANKACGAGNVTPHRLRGTFCTLVSEAGVPIQTVQKMMRHKDPKTTMAYLEVNYELAERGQAHVGERLGLLPNVPRETSV